MSDMAEKPASPALRPMPYHEAILAYLKTEEAEIWKWYASHKVREEQAEAVRFDLLKATYRIDRATQPAIYATAEDVARKLGLEVAVTLYQAQNPRGMNASIAFVPSEAHVVLHGPVATKLSDAEFRALLAHELGHLLMWRGWDGDYLVAEQILAALTHDALADGPHFATARLFALHTEVFCDRGALRAVADPMAVIAMLLKVETAAEEVSPASFLQQAEEVFRREGTKTAGLSHPETFIRARAVKLWADGDPQADRKVQAMLEGSPALSSLDLLAQQRVAALTRRLIDAFLSRRWMQTEAVVTHARLFFDDYAPPDKVVDDRDLAGDLQTDDQPLQDYYCYVLLDFVTADRDLEETPLAAALVLSETLGLKERFLEIVRRELRLRKKQLETIDQDKEGMLAQANAHIASP